MVDLSRSCDACGGMVGQMHSSPKQPFSLYQFLRLAIKTLKRRNTITN